jgi:hypothetical protein
MGTLTITTTTEQDQRILAAFKDRFMLDTNPTQSQIKAWLIEQLKNVVLEYERNEAVRLAQLSEQEFTPT